VLGFVLLGWLAAGCATGTSASQPSSAQIRTELVQARDGVMSYVQALDAAVKHSPMAGSAVALGSYRGCRSGKNLVSYVEAITVKLSEPATMARLGDEVTGILRSEGWRVVSVDFSRVHLALADTNHPLYDMSLKGMTGAANILPSGSDSAAAIIFIHSPCVDAGSLAEQAERGGSG
jgi:hypothetical protein